MENKTEAPKKPMTAERLKILIHDAKVEIKMLNKTLAAPTMPERPTMDDIWKLMNGEYTMEEKRVCDKENLEKITKRLAEWEAQLAEMETEK